MKGANVDITTTEERVLVVYCGCGEELYVNDCMDEKTEIQVIVNPHICKEAPQ